MKILSYVWTVLIGLVEIGITISLFSNSSYSDPFQIKVLAILVIIYTTIRTMGMGLGQVLIGLVYRTDEEFKKLRKINGNVFNDEIADELEKEEQEEVLKNIKKLKVKTIINSIIIAIMYFIAVYNLVISL